MIHTSVCLGVVRIFYEVRQGSMRLLSKDLVLAKAREDFMNASTYIDVPDGATSAVLPVQIVDDDIPEVEETFVVTLTEAQQMTQRNSSFYPKLGWLFYMYMFQIIIFIHIL